MILHRLLDSVTIKFELLIVLTIFVQVSPVPSEVTQSCGESDAVWTETRSCDMERRERRRVALVLGASGETGGEVVKRLVEGEEFTRVVLVTRRHLQLPDDSRYKEKIVQEIVDFDALSSHHSAVFRGVDTAFCCLGTTRAVAGAEGFVKVDHDYVLAAASLLKEAGCPEFHLLTSTGAKASSWLLYSSTKGKVEEAVKSLAFDKLSIYRPGLLLCARKKTRFMGKQ